MDGATVGEANGWSLNPAEGLPLIGDLNSSCTNRPFHRPRNMHIVGSDPAFHVSGCSDVNNLTDQLTLNSARQPQGSFLPGNPERSFEHRYRYDPSEMTFQGEFVGSCYLLVAIPSPRAEALCDLFSREFERSCFPRGVKIVDMSLRLRRLHLSNRRRSGGSRGSRHGCWSGNSEQETYGVQFIVMEVAAGNSNSPIHHSSWST